MRQFKTIIPDILITSIQAWLLYTVFSALTDDSNTEHTAQRAANGLSALGTLMLAQMFNRLFLENDTAENPCVHRALDVLTLLPAAVLTSIASWNSPANLQANPDIPAALLSGQSVSFLSQMTYFFIAAVNQKDPYKIWGHCASAAANGIGMLAMSYAATRDSNHYNLHQAEAMHVSATLFTLVGVGLHILSAALMITSPYYQATQAAIADDDRVDPQAALWIAQAPDAQARLFAIRPPSQRRAEQVRLARLNRATRRQPSIGCTRRP